MSQEGSDEDGVVAEFPFSSDEADAGEYTCGECGETFDTERGRNIHVGQVHDAGE